MIELCDNFLCNPVAVREHALACEFSDFKDVGGTTYKRVCINDVPGFKEALEAKVGPIKVHLMGYRLNFAEEMPNSRVHSDIGLGTHAAVLYLCEGPGGTAFWVHRDTGVKRLDASEPELFERTRSDWDKADAWEMYAAAPLAFNRAVVYDSSLFHSRWPWEAFGDNPRNGRLVAVAFFTPANKTTVRRAVESDIPDLMDLSQQFFASTNYAKFAALDEPSTLILMRAAIESQTLIIARRGLKAIGMAAALVIPFMFNRNVKTAHEIAWWVTPSERTGRTALEMLKALDDACAEAGVVAAQLSHLASSADAVSKAYQRRGYEHSETCYTKVYS